MLLPRELDITTREYFEKYAKMYEVGVQELLDYAWFQLDKSEMEEHYSEGDWDADFQYHLELREEWAEYLSTYEESDIANLAIHLYRFKLYKRLMQSFIKREEEDE